MMDRLGWLFCEIAFRGWDAMPERFFANDEPRWFARPCDALLSLINRLGCWCYGRAAE